MRYEPNFGIVENDRLCELAGARPRWSQFDWPAIDAEFDLGCELRPRDLLAASPRDHLRVMLRGGEFDETASKRREWIAAGCSRVRPVVLPDPDASARKRRGRIKAGRAWLARNGSDYDPHYFNFRDDC